MKNALRRGGRSIVIEFFGRQGKARSATSVLSQTAGVVVAHQAVKQVCSSQSLASCSEGTVPRSRRRPPVFGLTVPRITTRGLATARPDDAPLFDGGELEQDDHDDCPMCRKFSKGPCGHRFKKWLACTDSHPGKDAQGEPLHLQKCSDLAHSLAECLGRNGDYYSNNAEEDPPASTSKPNVDQWKAFANKMEKGIECRKYTMSDFPSETLPRVQISRSGTGAVFIGCEDVKRQTIIAAYILDEQGELIAAGSKHDMELEAVGCVLQFKISNGLKEVTIRTIYDSEDEDAVVIYTMKAKLSYINRTK
mmetsp:Transcript_23767/g.53956  ORF Transcript_23767/g.53956 Transcript_23767/m.53956 type:complete len:307 (+) Transcript_23767:226-1146(+)